MAPPSAVPSLDHDGLTNGTMKQQKQNLQSDPKQEKQGTLEFDPIPECIEAFRQGHFLIVLDSPNRENEGDLVISAAALTPSTCSFMIRHTSGYLCAPLPISRARELSLQRMVEIKANEDPNGTAYCVSVDAAAKWGTTTGISAKERAATANILAGVSPCTDASEKEVERKAMGPDDLRKPGHLLPLLARDGGVRERSGHTEAGVELARLAGYEPPVSVIGELVEEDLLFDADVNDEPGRPGLSATGMMRAEGCLQFGKKWGIRVCTIEGLVDYLQKEKR